MNSRFTAKAQRVLNNSLVLARELGHTYIGSEHLLLALCAEEDCAAAKLLARRGVDAGGVRESIVTLMGEGTQSDVSPADMTPRTKRIIEHSAIEARRTGQGYIGTEHLLVALLCEEDCVACRILTEHHVRLDELRRDASALFGSLGNKSEGKAKSSGKQIGRAHV